MSDRRFFRAIPPPAVPEKLTGIECTYQLPSADIIFPGQTQPKGPGTPAVMPTIPPMPSPIPKPHKQAKA